MYRGRLWSLRQLSGSDETISDKRSCGRFRKDERFKFRQKLNSDKQYQDFVELNSQNECEYDLQIF
jgi:hypothetical protein